MGDGTSLLEARPAGLYCPAGDFYVDPAEPVPRAVITHAHADHAAGGSGQYYAAAEGAGVIRRRLGAEAPVTYLAWGEQRTLGDAVVSLHPAGHILGSAQVRIAAHGEVWVVSGDYKRLEDPSCRAFEPVPCDVFVTESTFALPVYDWEPGEKIARDIVRWWDENAAAGRPSVLFCYALGKAQRILAELARLVDREVHVHGAIPRLYEAYAEAGVAMAPIVRVGDESAKGRKDPALKTALVMAPPSAYRSPWMRRFDGASTAFASGWMQVRGIRRRKGYDRGFALSDHAGWSELLRTVREVDPKRVLTMHGQADVLARYLTEQGRPAAPIAAGLRRAETGEEPLEAPA